MIHSEQKSASFWLALDDLFIPSTPNERTQVLTTDTAIMALSEFLASDDLAFSSQDKPQDPQKAESESYDQSVSNEQTDSSHETEQKPDAQVTTNASDDAVLAFTTQQWAAYFMLTGHSVFLETAPFGHEGLVTSKPWDLGIEYTPLEIKQVTMPVIAHLTPVIPVEDSCCEHRLDIDVTYFQYPQGSSEVGFTVVHDTFSEELLNNAFNFTFVGCGEDGPYILYTPNAEAIALFEQYQGISNYFLDIPPFPYEIGIENAEEFDIDCDCPITTINIFAGFGEPFQLDFANIFDFMNDNVTFSDCHDDTWFLTTGGTGFILVPYEATAPLVFDLKGDGIELTSSHHSDVLFDFNQDGSLSRTGWVGADDALLLYDYQGGQAQPQHFALTSLVEGASTDLQALVMLVNESDGVLDGTNPNWDKLGLWQDANQDGITDIGEYFTLSDLGIASISLNSTSDPYVDNGNTVHGLLTFSYENGNTGIAADVSLRYEDVMHSTSNTSESSNASMMTHLTSPVAQPQSMPAMDEVQQQVVVAI